MSTARRPKWYLQQPPSPKILHLPRQTRRKTQKHVARKLSGGKETEVRRSYRGKLESLLDQERTFSKPIPIVLLNSVGECERRGRVEVDREAEGGFPEEKWMFQADILRAECNFLRMEREVALKKLDRNRVKIERTLRSAVQTLISVSLCFSIGFNSSVA